MAAFLGKVKFFTISFKIFNKISSGLNWHFYAQIYFIIVKFQNLIYVSKIGKAFMAAVKFLVIETQRSENPRIIRKMGYASLEILFRKFYFR